MGDNVWMQSFAQIANFLSSLFASSSSPSEPSNGTASQNVPAIAAPSTSTLRNATTLAVIRDPMLATADALFGRMSYKGQPIGVTMERTAVAIPEGEYRGYKRWSGHFGMTVVGIDVPSRSDIECHPANFPLQLDGCIAIGETKDGDALDNSRAAFDRMMAVLPGSFTFQVSSIPA